jgi:hypothetical protein
VVTAIAIPEGLDPPEAALQLLRSVVADAVGELKQRVEGCRLALSAMVESARLDQGVQLRDVLVRSARQLRLRNLLESRLRVLDPGTSLPVRTSVDAEVYALLASVRRWRSGSPLQGERARLIDRVQGELGEVNADIGAMSNALRSGTQFTLHFASPEIQSGLDTGHDAYLDRVEKLLTRRAALMARLQRLDAAGDTGRASACASALQAAGGAEAIAAALAPMQAGREDQVLRAKTTLVKLQERVDATDPETHRHAELVTQLRSETERLQSLQEASEAGKVASARAIVTNAQTGRLVHLATCQAEVTRLAGANAKTKAGPGLAALAEAIGSARGEALELVACVAEILEGR